MRTIQELSRLSVILPTLDAAATLPQTLSSLCSAGPVGEIIVVDGGSGDRTVATAAAASARVMTSARGRGMQLATGAAVASGEWLLFLHADCHLEPGWAHAVGAFIAAPEALERAGYFELVLDDPARAARLIEWIVGWRCRVLALPYGDQGLLISRRLYDAVGGFTALPLMEDVELARRLGRDRLVPIGARCIASAERYRRDGYWRRPLRNLICLSLYFAGLPPARIVRLYG
ncbi:MAG: TIGR04283 family arsenosugar biosynthesis glycosyltransferase [Stellaceae bacterium]